MKEKIQLTDQADGWTVFHGKIVPIINAILKKAGKKDPGSMMSWITFKKSFKNDTSFGSDSWEISKSDNGGQATREITYLVILNGDCVFEARELNKTITVKTFDQVTRGDWPRLFFSLGSRIKSGKIK